MTSVSDVHFGSNCSVEWWHGSDMYFGRQEFNISSHMVTTCRVKKPMRVTRGD